MFITFINEIKNIPTVLLPKLVTVLHLIVLNSKFVEQKTYAIVIYTPS